MELAGRHVVVTGAAGGIGSALARRFHAAGARLTLTDLHQEALDLVAAPLLADRPGSVVTVPADIGTEAGNVAVIDAGEAVHGEVDLFFANAGVGIGRGPESP
ncbi:MAG: SDR family NAD(P)-dependent oxidoreductase, partial [Ilumatobacteraceae bacterium]